MRPLMLHGHDRSVTQIRYNLEGDLLFSVAKDSKPTVWYSSNGERLGTYNGHNGAVWGVDVSRDSSRVLTGSADNSTRLWDTETGTQLNLFETGSAVRTCMFSYSSNLFVYTTDATMGSTCEIILYDVRDLEAPIRESVDSLCRDDVDTRRHCEEEKVPVEGSKVTAALWGPFDEYFVTGHENGAVCRYDVTRSGHCLQSVKEHKDPISDLQASSDQIMIVTASKDHSAKLLDAESLDVLKTFRTERPVNSAALSPIKDHVVLGGGQEAREVTTTTSKAGKFDARFYHLVYEEEIGRVKGHFGPINSLKFHPDGKSYSSGGEDGYVRVHTFDSSYFDFEF